MFPNMYQSLKKIVNTASMGVKNLMSLTALTFKQTNVSATEQDSREPVKNHEKLRKHQKLI